jgi:hypothetical protein
MVFITITNFLGIIHSLSLINNFNKNKTFLRLETVSVIR